MNRSKKQPKPFEEPHWECSVCTYRNASEAFKCLICDVRKGTSTRKPKVNLQLTSHSSQQYGASSGKLPKKDEERRDKSEIRRKKKKKCWRPFKLKNVDRSTAQAREITINNLTISITEYKVKDKRSTSDQIEHSSTSDMSSHSESGFDTSSTNKTQVSHSFL